MLDTNVSDLFFNYSHDAYGDEHRRAHRAKGNPDDGVLKAGILADAQEFAETVNRAWGIALDPAELAADFWARE